RELAATQDQRSARRRAKADALWPALADRLRCLLRRRLHRICRGRTAAALCAGGIFFSAVHALVGEDPFALAKAGVSASAIISQQFANLLRAKLAIFEENFSHKIVSCLHSRNRAATRERIPQVQMRCALM